MEFQPGQWLPSDRVRSIEVREAKERRIEGPDKITYYVLVEVALPTGGVLQYTHEGNHYVNRENAEEAARFLAKQVNE